MTAVHAILMEFWGAFDDPFMLGLMAGVVCGALTYRAALKARNK